VGRVVKLRWIALGAACAWWATAPRPACAHPEQAPTLVNRYLTVAPAGTQLGLHAELLFGIVPASEQRQSLDRDHDGTISSPERSAGARAWTARADQIVRLTLDGHPTPIELGARIDLGGDNRADDKPLLVELTGQIELGPGEHRIEIDAGPDLPRMGETEIVLDSANPWLLRANLDDRGQVQAPQKLVRHPGPRAHPEDRRAATFVVYSGGPAEPEDQANPMLPIAMVSFSLILGIVLVVLVRRLERSRRGRHSDTTDTDAAQTPK
jgi:hypothetical protein